ncbi:hypothetical protein RhiirA5_369027 [Rhizophagus irregularis]|uniref:Uncharacterized protein n=1 Tax=Rhizophagus irregularis TaxID=588596 RepID=A0A2N0SJX7_9GLOM|nr:hypothetical protein RhiirA5_369027 [Rhizophagus irregularis]PKC75872.1 hypothetical protein RhiirA1_386971 [Rhizophagus irregularis]
MTKVSLKIRNKKKYVSISYLLNRPLPFIQRMDFQAVAAPNASPDFLEKFPTNCSMIDTVNNLFLEKYPSYSGHKTSDNKARKNKGFCQAFNGCQLVLKFQTKHLGKTVYRNEDEGEDEILYGYPILIIKYNVAGLNARNITSAIVAQVEKGDVQKLVQKYFYKFTG